MQRVALADPAPYPPGQRPCRRAAVGHRPFRAVGPHGQRARARRPTRRRGDDGAEPPPQAVDARRADRRHGAGGNRAHGQADPRPARAAEAEHPVHRARHGPRLRHRRPDHRAQLRQGPRNRDAEGSRRRPPGASGVSWEEAAHRHGAARRPRTSTRSTARVKHPARRVDRGRRGRDRHALLGRNGAGKTTTLRSPAAHPAARGTDRDLRVRTPRARPPTRSPAPASAMCRRGARSSRT